MSPVYLYSGGAFLVLAFAIVMGIRTILRRGDAAYAAMAAAEADTGMPADFAPTVAAADPVEPESTEERLLRLEALVDNLVFWLHRSGYEKRVRAGGLIGSFEEWAAELWLEADAVKATRRTFGPAPADRPAGDAA